MKGIEKVIESFKENGQIVSLIQESVYFDLTEYNAYYVKYYVKNPDFDDAYDLISSNHYNDIEQARIKFNTICDKVMQP